MKTKPILDVEPKNKGMYAWNAIHAGSFLLYVESLKDCHKFLFLPGPSEYYLTFNDFTKCIKSNTLEFVEQLPNDIFEETIKISLACPPRTSMILSNEKTIQEQESRAVS